MTGTSCQIPLYLFRVIQSFAQEICQENLEINIPLWRKKGLEMRKTRKIVLLL